MYINFGETKRTDDELWNSVVSDVKASNKYGLKNQWNARKASYAVNLYKEKGGGYKGKKPSPTDNKLKKWLAEDWQTYDGKPAIQKDDKGNVIKVNRYLPKKAWENLSPAQVAATNRAKRKGFKQGNQFVPNAPAAKKAGQKARNYEYME